MLDPAAGILLAAALALLFASAAWHKLRALAQFTAVFVAYRVLPPAVSGRIAWTVPALELAIAAALPWEPSRRAASVAGAAILTAYAGGIALNLARGRRDLDCGCAGPGDRRPIAGWMLWRNLLLAAALGIAAMPWSPRALVVLDILTIAGGLAVAALLYVALDRLLGQVMPRSAALKGAR
jgi:hypothetical protein